MKGKGPGSWEPADSPKGPDPCEGVLACKHVWMTLAVYLQSTALSGSIMPGLMELHSSKCFLSCVDCTDNIPSGSCKAWWP